MLHRTFTNRFEIKYLVSVKRAEKLRHSLGALFSVDENAGDMPGYYNYSIYFDSPRYHFYREKQEGNIDRMKPRLRTHLPTIDAVPDQWFLELKGRHNKTVQKRRAPVSQETAHSLVKGGSQVEDEKHETLLDFEYMWTRLGLRPAVAVHYFREPLNSAVYPNVRITFDHRISGSLDFTFGGCLDSRKFVHSPTEVLVELKFTGSIPRVVLEIFRRNEMQQSTFSKYAICLENCVDQLPGVSGYRSFSLRQRP
jgi:hypothetical protein